eukprot:SAG22_NODE_21580_length_256_cov_0.547771_1_plen_54_part_10
MLFRVPRLPYAYPSLMLKALKQYGRLDGRLCLYLRRRQGAPRKGRDGDGAAPLP